MTYRINHLKLPILSFVCFVSVACPKPGSEMVKNTKQTQISSFSVENQRLPVKQSQFRSVKTQKSQHIANPELASGNEIERSEIPAACRDEPKICAIGEICGFKLYKTNPNIRIFNRKSRIA
jgi:hypothetical protein